MDITKFTHRLWLVRLLFCALAFGASGLSGTGWSQVPAASPSAHPVSDKFEKVAAQLEFFDLKPFLYNRADLDFRPADDNAGARYFALLNDALDPQIPVAEIAPLRKHTDAKVRTLALAALFQRNDPHLLPLIMELAGDTTPTFPGYTKLSPSWLAMTGIGPPPEKQSVGDVASAMVNFYLKHAGFHHGIAGSGNQPGFAGYWAQRKDRKFCASWFAVALARAGRETAPDYGANIAAVRKRIQALPAADRDWTLLYLNGELGRAVLSSEAELIAAAKRRGADALLAVLREKIPSDDPDVQRRDNNDWPYERLMTWILARAPQLLRRDMADDLLACESWQRDYRKRNSSNPFINAAWPVAASRLQPQHGRQILKDAWTRFDLSHDGYNRLLLMVALTEVGDARDYPFISTWFFDAPPKKYDGIGSQGKQFTFFDLVAHQDRVALRPVRQMVARLIKDKRFDNAEFWAIWNAAKLVNTWSKSPIVDTQKLFEAGRIHHNKAAWSAARDTLRRTSAKWSQ